MIGQVSTMLSHLIQAWIDDEDVTNGDDMMSHQQNLACSQQAKSFELSEPKLGNFTCQWLRTKHYTRTFSLVQE